MSLYSKYKKKILAIISTAVVVAFVATIFVAWGLQGYSSVKDTSVGSVNNEKISRMEYIDQLIQQENSFKQYGLPVDNEDVRRTIENMAFETAILEKLLFQKANPENIRISDQRIYNVISHTPDFQKDGVFSPELYHNLLKQSRYTEDKYEQKIIKKTLLVQTLKNLMLDTVRVSENITEDFFRLENYKAEVILYKLDTTQLKKGIKITENDILSYFENNKSTEFSSQTKHIRVKFVNIFPREVANRSVTESVVEEKYSSNKTDYTVEIKSWKISHLLFKKREDAEKYLKKVKSDKSKFDQYLKDKGSTLGWFQKRDMLSESFADAVYFLKKGGIYPEIVTTVRGHHIIRLDDLRVPGDILPFDEVKIKIKSRLVYERILDIRKNIKKYTDEIEAAMNSSEMELPYDLHAGITDFFNIESIPEEFGLFTEKKAQDKLFSLATDGTASFRTDNGAVIIKLIETVQPYIAEYEDVRKKITKKVKKSMGNIIIRDTIQAIEIMMQKGLSREIIKRFPFIATQTAEFGIMESVQNADEAEEDLSFLSSSVDFFVAVFGTAEGEFGGPVNIYNDYYYVKPLSITEPDISDFMLSEHSQIAGKAQRQELEKVFQNWYQVEVTRSKILDLREGNR